MTTTPDYRAALTGLIAIVDAHCNPTEYELPDVVDALTRARELLAAPEVVGVALSDPELNAMAFVFGQPCYPFDHLGYAHAILARLARYGTAHPAPIPASERLPGVADDSDVIWALVKAEAALADIGDAEREPGDDLAWCERRAAEALPVVREALAFCSTAHPAPIPVGERLPEVGDCNDEGEVWIEEPGAEYALGDTGDYDWEPHRYVLRCIEERDHRHNRRYLPHWALPLPGPAR